MRERRGWFCGEGGEERRERKDWRGERGEEEGGGRGDSLLRELGEREEDMESEGVAVQTYKR